MIRLDQLLVDQDLMPSRARAGVHIKEHGVLVDGKEVRKPGKKFAEDCRIQLLGEAMPWVGRGALKLAHAIELWDIQLKGATSLDVGASTGGFTEVMLHAGAEKVFSVDTGREQLHESLKSHAQVVSLEQTDIRDLAPDAIDPCAFFGVDVSFISLRFVLPVIPQFCQPGAQGIVLVKPQFEVGRDQVGKGGIVRDQNARNTAIRHIKDFATSLNFRVLAECPSPITGGDGNREHLLWLSLRSAP